MKRKRLGEVLCERGQISAADLKKALQDQQVKFVHLGELLLQRKLVSKQELTAAVGEVSGVEYLDCERVDPPADVLKLIPAELAKRSLAIPIRIEDKKLVVVMAKPQNIQVLDELRFKTGLAIVPRFGFQGEVVAALDRLYGALERPAEAVQVADDTMGMEFISSSSQQRNIEAMREMQQELQQKSKATPAVHLVAGMIKAAAAKQASDIHIEPRQAETAVRLPDRRHPARFSADSAHAAESGGVSRQDLSDMDIAERRAPQDGRFLAQIKTGRRIDSPRLHASYPIRRKSCVAAARERCRLKKPTSGNVKFPGNSSSARCECARALCHKECSRLPAQPARAKAPPYTAR